MTISIRPTRALKGTGSRLVPHIKITANPPAEPPTGTPVAPATSTAAPPAAPATKPTPQ